MKQSAMCLIWYVFLLWGYWILIRTPVAGKISQADREWGTLLTSKIKCEDWIVTFSFKLWEKSTLQRRWIQAQGLACKQASFQMSLLEVCSWTRCDLYWTVYSIVLPLSIYSTSGKLREVFCQVLCIQMFSGTIELPANLTLFLSRMKTIQQTEMSMVLTFIAEVTLTSAEAEIWAAFHFGASEKIYLTIKCNRGNLHLT